MAYGFVIGRFLLERPDFFRGHSYLDVLVPLFLHTSVLGRPGLSYLISQGETAAVPLRCRASGKSLLGEQTEFCGHKSTTCLENPATQGNVIPGSFLRQNYRGKGLPYKMHNTILQGTYHFDRGIGNIRLLGMSEGFALVYVYDAFRLRGISGYEMRSGLVSDGRLCRFIHL